ncbi:hypothetical protein VPH35_100190 [Triticum aestivum]
MPRPAPSRRPSTATPNTLLPVHPPPRQRRVKVHLASSSSPTGRAHHSSSGRAPEPVHTPSSAARAAVRSASRAPLVEHRPSLTSLACLAVVSERDSSRARLGRSDTVEQGRATAHRAEQSGERWGRETAHREEQSGERWGRAAGRTGHCRGEEGLDCFLVLLFRVLCVNF